MYKNFFLYKNLIDVDRIKYFSKINIKWVKDNSKYIVKRNIEDENILLKNDKYNFILGQDLFTNMTVFIFQDLIMFDWDEIIGIPKTSVIDMIKIFIKNKDNNLYIDKSEICFKIYETCNGIHGFLVSHKISHDSDIVLYLQTSLYIDPYYSIRTYKKGTHVRLSPKTNNDFIQKEGFVYKGKNIMYVGNKKKIDPTLDYLTDLIYKTQEHLKSIKNKDYLEEIKNYVINEIK